MATNNLEVKFKVETSDLRKGSSDAKRTVKDTADSMARDVNGAAQNMSSSMGKVNDATKQIADAANTASNGVRSLEQNVARSATNMEQSLAKVSRQMSTMQMFHMGVKGVQMLGGTAANVARLAGDDKLAEAIDAATSVGSSALQGAATGAMIGSVIPGIGNGIGAAVGGLVGAGSALLEAAAKQSEAAEKQLEAARRSITESKEKIALLDADVQSRRRIQRVEEIANMPVGAFDEKFAQGEIDKAKEDLRRAEARQNLIQDMMYGRNGVETTVDDWGKALGYKNAKYFSIAGSEMSLDDLPKNLGVVNWLDPKSEKLVPALIARHIAEKFRDPFVDKILGTEDREGREGIDRLINDNIAWPIMHHVYRIPKATFDGIVDDLFKTLAAKAEDAARQVAEAQKRLSELAPIQARLDKERAASEARMAEPFNFGEAEDFTQEPRAWIDVDKEALAAGAQKLKDLTSLLNGVVKGTGFASPTDALTRIGGGRGYASYNDSAARVQKNIEANLKTLIKNQTEQNADILHAIENIGLNENAIEWQEDN